MATKRKSPDVKLSNLEKVFFPQTRFTKGDLIQYYLKIAPLLLPHLKNRPVTLIRFPDGVEGVKFYEKNAPKFTPSWIKTQAVSRRHESGRINYLLLNDAHALAWCINLGTIELHPFLHRAPRLAQPTCVVFDLDPGEGADVLDCGRVALLIKKILDGLKLCGFVKVSGSRGLQLYVPLNTKVTYPATGAFAKAVAELLAREHPDRVVSNMAKIQRKRKVLIDWSQNSAAKTTACVYSVRGKRAEPFVSLPITWEELKRAMRRKNRAALDFTPDAALKRVKKTGDLFAPVLTLKQKLPRAFLRAAVQDNDLRRYREKRDFSQTAEPAPQQAQKRTRRGAKTGRFVIQKHAASHLHYDLRFEMNGTLKSWAVPKGIPTALGEKHAAFEVEDHPVAYLKFEGTIPKGQYGGGTVMVWDIGTYELIGGSHEAGDLKVIFHGKKLKGEWHVFRIRDEEKPVWLVAKSRTPAKPISARSDDRSALTGRSMARIARDKDAEWSSSGPKRKAA